MYDVLSLYHKSKYEAYIPLSWVRLVLFIYKVRIQKFENVELFQIKKCLISRHSWWSIMSPWQIKTVNFFHPSHQRPGSRIKHPESHSTINGSSLLLAEEVLQLINDIKKVDNEKFSNDRPQEGGNDETIITMTCPSLWSGPIILYRLLPTMLFWDTALLLLDSWWHIALIPHHVIVSLITRAPSSTKCKSKFIG